MKTKDQIQFNYNEIIKICPHCNVAMTPDVITEEYIDTIEFYNPDERDNYVSILKCPNCEFEI